MIRSVVTARRWQGLPCRLCLLGFVLTSDDVLPNGIGDLFVAVDTIHSDLLPTSSKFMEELILLPGSH